MLDKSILEKVALFTPNSSEPSTTASSEEYYYTLAQDEGDYPLLLFNPAPDNPADVYAIAKGIADLKCGESFIVCRDDDVCIAAPGVDWVLNAFMKQDFESYLAVIDPQGEIAVAKSYEFYRQCTRPWRVSGGCAECNAVNNVEAKTPGDPCIFRKMDEESYSTEDLSAEDLRGILEKAKHPSIGRYQWISPIYTKPHSTVHMRGRWNSSSNGYFSSYLRSPDNHDFSRVHELRELQCRSAQTKADIRRKIRDTCNSCSFKKACDSYHYGTSTRYVQWCNSETKVTPEQIITAYAGQYKDVPRELITFVLSNVGPLPWRHNRHKLFMSVDLAGTDTQVHIRYKTKPWHKAFTFRTFQVAADYLRNHLKKNQELLWTPENNLSDETLALYEIACQYNSSPVRGHGWHKTSYDTRYIRPRYRGVEMTFSSSGGRSELYWTLDIENVFDGFKYYGRQRIPRYLLSD